MKKSLKPRHFIIDDNVFMVKVHVCVNCTDEYFYKYIERKYDTIVPKIKGSGGNFLSCDTAGGPLYCLWLESFDKTVWKLGVLDHEISHCTYSIIKDRGMDINDETMEVFAYYHSFLFTEIYKKLLK